MSTTVGRSRDVGRRGSRACRRALEPRRWPARCRRRRRSPAPSSSRFASSWIQPVTSVSAGPPFGGLYLNPPSSGGLCDGVTTIPSASPARPPAPSSDRGIARPRFATMIACETAGVGVNRSSDVDADVDAARDEHLERGRGGRLGQGVRVAAHEQRAVVAVRVPVAADRLGDREDVGLVEGATERRAAMAGRPEGDALGRVGRIRADVVVGTRRARRRRRGSPGSAGWPARGSLGTDRGYRDQLAAARAATCADAPVRIGSP